MGTGLNLLFDYDRKLKDTIKLAMDSAVDGRNPTEVVAQ